MEYNALILLCALGGAAVVGLMDRVVCGVFATILSACAALGAHSLVRKRVIAYIDCSICVRQS